MIVIDASAVVAILLEEPGYEALADRLRAADDRVMSPVTAVEVVMALARRFSEPSVTADLYFRRSAIGIHPTDADQAYWAQQAFLTFGKGRHPAKLNLGDCFSFAAAKSLNAPLLYVGGDFAKTDIKTA